MIPADQIEIMATAAELTRPMAHRVVADCLRGQFPVVCVPGVYVADFAKALHGSETRLCAVVGYPLGNMKATVRTIEATAAAKDDAGEIEFVAHLPHLLRQDIASVKFESLELVKAVRTVRPSTIVRMAIETAVLLREVSAAEGEARIAAACQAARESGCDCVVAGTGYHPAGAASPAAVALLKKHSGGMYVKAVNLTLDPSAAQALLDAGADRVACGPDAPLVQQLLR